MRCDSATSELVVFELHVHLTPVKFSHDIWREKLQQSVSTSQHNAGICGRFDEIASATQGKNRHTCFILTRPRVGGSNDLTVICLSVCLSVNSIIRNVMNEFSRQLENKCKYTMDQSGGE